MPVPVWEANDSFIKFEEGTEDVKGQIDVVHLPAALRTFFASFHLPHPAQLARNVVCTCTATPTGDRCVCILRCHRVRQTS